MALNPLTLSVVNGVQGQPFEAAISGQAAGTELTIERGYSPGFSVVNGRLMSTGLPYAVSTAGIRERNINTGETRLTIIDITAATIAQMDAQAAAAVPGYVSYALRQVYNGEYSYSLAIRSSTAATTVAAVGASAVTLGTLTLSGTLQIGTAASGTIIGATAGSTITGNIPGITINSAARTYSGTPTGSAQTISNGLVETLAGATNTPNSSAITVAAAAPATFTLTQLPYANAIYQRDAETGGGQGVGTGTIPQPINITGAGALYARRRSIDGSNTTLQAPWLVTANAVVGDYTTNKYLVSGVDVPLLNTAGTAPVTTNDGWFYLDFSGDGTTWTNSTVAVTLGDLTAVTGQSLAKRFTCKASGMGNMGVTPSEYTRSFVTNEVYSTTTMPTGGWRKAIDSALTSEYNAAPHVYYMNQLCAVKRCAQGVIGYSNSGQPQDFFQPGGFGLGFTRHAAIVAGAWGDGSGKGKYKYEMYLQGHDDGKNGVLATSYQQSAAYRNNVTNGFGFINSFPSPTRVMASIPNLSPTSGGLAQYGYPRQINYIRAGSAAEATARGLTYLWIEDIRENDGIHEDQFADLGYALARAVLSDNNGPVLTAATRLTSTTTRLTFSQPGTDFTLVGNWWNRVCIYMAGSLQNRYLPSGGSRVSATQLDITHEAAGVGDAFDVYVGMATDSDNSGGTYFDPFNNIIRDDRTADGIAYGRNFVPNTTAIVAAALTPGGASTPPATTYPTQSFYDMTMTSPTYDATELIAGFGSVLTAGFGTSIRAEIASLPNMSIQGGFKCPNTPTATAVMFQMGNVLVSVNTSRKIQVSIKKGDGTSASVLSATALTAGVTYFIRVDLDPVNGVKIFIQDRTGGANPTVSNNAASVALPAPFSITGGKVGLASNNGASSFFANSTGGALFEWAVFHDALTVGNYTGPSAPLTGAESNLVCLFHTNSTDNGKDALRYA